MKIAVYSNYCGGDAGAKANVNSDRVEWHEHFFYTNNGNVATHMQRAGWTIRMTNAPLTNDQIQSCMAAKEEKIRSHLLADLQGFDYVIFRDAKMKGLDFSMLPKIIRLMEERGLHAAFPVHRRNVCAEACESMFQPRYANQRQQITDYIRDELKRGFLNEMPMHFGCNISVRKVGHVDTMPMNNMWFDHTQRVGLQDQISFHFVAQSFPNILPIPQEFGFRKSEVPAPDWL